MKGERQWEHRTARRTEPRIRSMKDCSVASRPIMQTLATSRSSPSGPRWPKCSEGRRPSFYPGFRSRSDRNQGRGACSRRAAWQPLFFERFALARQPGQAGARSIDRSHALRRNAARDAPRSVSEGDAERHGDACPRRAWARSKSFLNQRFLSRFFHKQVRILSSSVRKQYLPVSPAGFFLPVIK